MIRRKVKTASLKSLVNTADGHATLQRAVAQRAAMLRARGGPRPMRNLLGWLRPGWLQIASIYLNIA